MAKEAAKKAEEEILKEVEAEVAAEKKEIEAKVKADKEKKPVKKGSKLVDAIKKDLGRKEPKEEKEQKVKPKPQKKEKLIEKAKKTLEEAKQAKKAEKPKAPIKKVPARVYTIPLKKRAPRGKKSRVAMSELKSFVAKHTKNEVRVSREVNEKIFSCGRKKPPAKLRIEVIQDEEGRSLVKLKSNALSLSLSGRNSQSRSVDPNTREVKSSE